jgi:hypothetical protein
MKAAQDRPFIQPPTSMNKTSNAQRTARRRNTPTSIITNTNSCHTSRGCNRYAAVELAVKQQTRMNPCCVKWYIAVSEMVLHARIAPSVCSGQVASLELARNSEEFSPVQLTETGDIRFSSDPTISKFLKSSFGSLGNNFKEDCGMTEPGADRKYWHRPIVRQDDVVQTLMSGKIEAGTDRITASLLISPAVVTVKPENPGVLQTRQVTSLQAEFPLNGDKTVKAS